MDSQEKKIIKEGNGVFNEELKQVTQLFTSLLLTVKNLSLYPHGHTICENSIKHFFTLLSSYLNKYSTLKFEIEREKIIYKGEIISAEAPEEGSLHHTLFRDGIRWFQFTNGIDEKEIHDFLSIMNKYAKLSAEPEGDIATALWEISFRNIQYEVADFFWDSDSEKDKFSDLISGKSVSNQPVDIEWRESVYEDNPEIDLKTIKHTPAEEIKLKEMIRTEEDADITSYLDALLDSLIQNREESIFIKILDALSDEYTLSLMRKDFIVTLKILQGLHYVLDICAKEMPWAKKHIEGFFVNASGTESLKSIQDIWGQIEAKDADILREIFMLLNPKVIHTLIPLLSQSQGVPIRKMLLDLIVMLASQDTQILEIALHNTNENLLERLVSVIVGMDGGQALKYLTKLSGHSSGRIRYEAVKGILKLDPARIKDMLNLIEDKDDSISQFILEYMGHTRDEVIEEFLVSYISKNKSGNLHADHLIKCFRTLGRCGSLRSIPFLKETLLKWGFLKGARRTNLRRGAAIALVMLGITQADEILERAGRSVFSGVKGVVNSVIQELNEEAGRSGK